MTNETKPRLKKTLSPARWELQSSTDRMRRHEGGRDPRARGKKTKREAHKRSMRLFNFHIHCDIYKLPQQTGERADKRGQEERDPRRPHGLLAPMSRDHRWGRLAVQDLKKGGVFERI